MADDVLTRLAFALDSAPRQGSDRDEPEGARFVQISDTLAKSLSARLRRLAAEPETRTFLVGHAMGKTETMLCPIDEPAKPPRR